jgi:hypothetical protein
VETGGGREQKLVGLWCDKVGCVVMRSGPRGRSGRDDIREFFKNGKNVCRNRGKRGNNRRRW